MDRNTIKITVTVILVNLSIGNGILFLGGLNSFNEDVNYPLMIGMSVACIVFYILFFRYSKFENYNTFKLILTSVLSCMTILFIGNSLALMFKEPISEVIDNLPAAIFMGMMGIMIFFPVSLILGLLNFSIITYLKRRKTNEN
ncbi:hypothetical protein [Chryseobacterium luteum]|uniref:Uncharacterized protein n=1 Tax=Chryseobacterium luteum TaxID=421531 RepID=A0A085ZBC8_9FLAO|nr:hypothetical protein [Chryseobacterium luteum]KFF01742.1 hypothetical protein IX38_16895 [Chryseobacterium luteum]